MTDYRLPRTLLPWLVLLAALTASVSALAQEHTLNLEKAKIQTLIATVSDITGKSFVVDPRVSGEVTVVSKEPMTPEEIYEVFLSILDVHGLAAVPSGETVKIVPDTAAKQDSIGMFGQQEGADALVTHVIQPEHVSATDLEPLLRPLIPGTGQLSVYGPANLLVISDSAGNVERLSRIIDRIDTATSKSDAEVIRLEHASASEIVRLVNSLYSQQGGSGPHVVADERTNTVLLTGDPGSRLRIKALVAHLDTPLESGGSTRVVYLDYADAMELVPILQSVSRALERTEGEGEAGGDASGVSIDAHPSTNALIITATPSIFRSLNEVIRQLDIRRAQVLVEAVIAEVALDTSEELGIQWQAADGFDDDSIIGGTNFGGPGSNILGLSRDPTAAGRGLSLGWLRGTATIPGTDDVVLELGALVRALQSDTNTNVLSTPSLVTMDNAEAQIQVGQEVPFLTGQFTTTGADDSTRNPFQTIEREDVGITLKVTPHINQGDAVRMDISQEVSSVAGTSLGAVDLITNKRTLNTSVLVGDGEILVLGGLIDDDVRETEDSVPLLGEIPLLGNLFKYRSASRVKRNLMVFLHPRILRDAATAREVTGGKYDYIRQLQKKARETEGMLTEGHDMPLLPEMYEYLGPRESAPGPDND